MSDSMTSPELLLQSLVDMPRSKQQDRSFGQRLAALRKGRGLTQVQLAQAARTTQRAFSYYENDDGLRPAAARSSSLAPSR
jgi:DNA-binding XRE family transcriptional regulator